jgi:translocation protein SEC63
MAFFDTQGDDSNLQYDDTAFLYFLSSLLACLILALSCSIMGAFSRLPLPHGKELSKATAFKDKLRKMKSIHRGKIINFGLFGKIMLLIACLGMIVWIYQLSISNSNSLKGFDPYQILGVNKDASLREIKKAYRKLAMEYHPDKNQGDPVAQNKFILISKSYECFTN